jgi:acetoin utilization protein AcuB
MDTIGRKRETLEQFMATAAEVRMAEAIKVGDVMTVAPECLSVHVTALDLVRRFHATGFRHLLLVDEQNRLAGIVSDRDVTRCFGVGSGPSSEELQGIAAADLMSSDLITVESNAPLDEVVGLLVDNGISSVPVVDDGRLVGILTNTDLILLLQSLLAAGRQQIGAAEMAATL